MNDEMIEQSEITGVEEEIATSAESMEAEPDITSPISDSSLPEEPGEPENLEELTSNEPENAAVDDESGDGNGSGESLAADIDELLPDGTGELMEDEPASLAQIEEIESDESINATREEIKPVIECLLFVAEEPLPFKVICKVLGTVPEDEVQLALDTLVAEYDARGCGFEIREVAGGWRISTRPQNHDFIRKYLKTRPSARLSLPALETLAVIAYKQPITVPEILEIRGVSSSSAIKTLLEKRLIVTRGRKETVGRPMMYGTSRDFLIQFGLKDLSELPSIEDFEDLAQ